MFIGSRKLDSDFGLLTPKFMLLTLHYSGFTSKCTISVGLWKYGTNVWGRGAQCRDRVFLPYLRVPHSRVQPTADGIQSPFYKRNLSIPAVLVSEGDPGTNTPILRGDCTWNIGCLREAHHQVLGDQINRRAENTFLEPQKYSCTTEGRI